MARPDVFVKDPAARLDYKFDWRADTNNHDPAASSDYLAAGETISSATVTADTGITVDTDSITDTNTSVTVWLTGGTDGEDYEVVCQIETSDSRTDQRTITIQCRER